MNFELDENEARILADALTHFVSNLREEIVKTEKHEWIAALHREEQVLNGILAKLTAGGSVAT